MEWVGVWQVSHLMSSWGLNLCYFMITGNTIGTTSGCVSPEETVDEK